MTRSSAFTYGEAPLKPGYPRALAQDGGTDELISNVIPGLTRDPEASAGWIPTLAGTTNPSIYTLMA